MLLKRNNLQEAFSDSLQPPVCLLTEVTNRLKLKDKPVQVESPCIQEENEDMWERIHEIDSSVQRTDSKQAQLKSRTELNAFMEHCCVRRKYFFSIKKCGEKECRF